MIKQATCHGYEWRGDVPWKCRLPPGHKTPDGTFLGRPCRGTATLLEQSCGFTVEQSHALAAAGYDVRFIPAEAVGL